MPFQKYSQFKKKKSKELIYFILYAQHTEKKIFEKYTHILHTAREWNLYVLFTFFYFLHERGREESKNIIIYKN